MATGVSREAHWHCNHVMLCTDLPIMQAQILAALPCQQIWCHLGWGGLETMKSSQISGLQHTTCFFLPQKDAQTAPWMSASLRWWWRNNTPFSQGRSHPRPWSDHHLSCLPSSCSLWDAYYVGGMKIMKVYIEFVEKLLVTSWLVCKHGPLVRPWAGTQVQYLLSFVLNCHITNGKK